MMAHDGTAFDYLACFCSILFSCELPVEIRRRELIVLHRTAGPPIVIHTCLEAWDFP